MLQSDKQDARQHRTFGRRRFLSASGAAIAALALWRHEQGGSVPVEAATKGPKQVKIVDFTDAGERKGDASGSRHPKKRERMEAAIISCFV